MRERSKSDIPMVFSEFTEWTGSVMAIVMLKSRQDCKSHESLLNFITTFPTMTTATKKLINPVNKTCETSSLHSIRVLHLKMTQFHYLCKNQILVIYYIRFLWKITLKGIHSSLPASKQPCLPNKWDPTLLLKDQFPHLSCCSPSLTVLNSKCS